MRTDRNQTWDSAGNLLHEEVVQVDDSVERNERTLQERAVAALQANAVYLAKGSPTAAENLAQIRLLTRECSALIRLLLRRLDATD